MCVCECVLERELQLLLLISIPLIMFLFQRDNSLSSLPEAFGFRQQPPGRQAEVRFRVHPNHNPRVRNNLNSRSGVNPSPNPLVRVNPNRRVGGD